MILNFMCKGLSPDRKSFLLSALARYGISARPKKDNCDLLLCCSEVKGALPKSRVAVTLASDASVMRRLCGTGCTVVTCGISGDDTLSLSSIGEGTAAVSLQRSIETLAGGQIEPCEIPIKTDLSGDGELVTAASAVLLIAGICPDKGYTL